MHSKATVSLLAATAFAAAITFLSARADSIQRAPIAWAIALSLWWTGALALLMLKSRSAFRGVAAVAYLLMASFFLLLTYRSEHSTAGIGLMLWPIPLYVAAGLFLAFENAARSPGERDGGDLRNR